MNAKELTIDDLDALLTKASDPKAEAIANADAHTNNAGLPTYSELVAALRMYQEAAEFVAGQREQHRGTCEIGQYRDGSYMTTRIATATCNRVRDAAEHGAPILARIPA